MLGCGTGAPLRREPPQTFPSQTESVPDAATPSAPQRQNPRATAALTLSEQAKTLLAQNEPDQAIRVLEQAINLHPEQGAPYYYLAEAWLQKGNYDQAMEFNRLASLYFIDDILWSQRIASQKNRIHRLKP